MIHLCTPAMNRMLMILVNEINLFHYFPWNYLLMVEKDLPLQKHENFTAHGPGTREQKSSTLA